MISKLGQNCFLYGARLFTNTKRFIQNRTQNGEIESTDSSLSKLVKGDGWSTILSLIDLYGEQLPLKEPHTSRNLLSRLVC